MDISQAQNSLINDYFEIGETHATFRPVGEIQVDEVIELTTSAILKARQNNISNLLVDLSAISGIESPSIGSRYFMVKKWAQVAHGYVRVAMVLREEIIDPGKFGVTAAANAGLLANVFSEVQEALEWLCEHKEVRE